MMLSQKRECAARLLAYAVLRAFPETKLVAGHATDLGFYYDFEFKSPVGPEVLDMLDEHLRHLMSTALPIQERSMLRQNAQEFFKARKQEKKVFSVDDRADGAVYKL